MLIDGTINPPAVGADSGILPTGWVSTYEGTGQYLITHNLGTKFYSVVCQSLSSSGLACIVASNENAFGVVFFDTSTQTATDSPFFFNLTQVNNKKQTPQSYQPSGVL